MARTSVVKRPVRSNRRTTKRAHPSEESEARPSKLTRESQRGEEDARPLPLDTPPSFAERVEAQRNQLFRVISIVECCKFATATLLEVDDSEYMVPAFEVICDLLNTSAEELEEIAFSVRARHREAGRASAANSE